MLVIVPGACGVTVNVIVIDDPLFSDPRLPDKIFSFVVRVPCEEVQVLSATEGDSKLLKTRFGAAKGPLLTINSK